jgi:hypothetical protein
VIRECRDVKPEEVSIVTLLREEKRQSAYGVVRSWRLKHHTAGFEIAGSCMRSTPEKWTVSFIDYDGARHGRQFLTLADGESHLAKCGEVVA